MLKTITLSACVAASLLAPVFGQSAKLVSVTAAAGVPESADFQVKPMGYKYGVTMHFFVTGENMISFDEKSLKADGWKLGSFPKVNDDGTQASFSIQKKGDFIGKVGRQNQSRGFSDSLYWRRDQDAHSESEGR